MTEKQKKILLGLGIAVTYFVLPKIATFAIITILIAK